MMDNRAMFDGSLTAAFCLIGMYKCSFVPSIIADWGTRATGDSLEKLAGAQVNAPCSKTAKVAQGDRVLKIRWEQGMPAPTESFSERVAVCGIIEVFPWGKVPER